MRRLTITLTIAFGLVAPTAAVASRLATGSTRNAIDRAAAPQVPPGIPERCLFAQVTTKDAGDWAEVGFNGVNGAHCVRWAFNGVVILRRARGRWDYVTSGSARISCGRIGIPVAVRQDLHLPCAVNSPTSALGAKPPASNSCSDEAVTVLELKPVAINLRVVVHGVSCSKAHSLIRAYFRQQATPGYCVSQGGDICEVKFPGGWVCSLPGAASEGDFAGCVREAPFATVKVYARGPVPVG
jgi:hypothetical protein